MIFINRLLLISLVFVGCGEQGFASEGNKLSADLAEKSEQYKIYRQENVVNPCDRSLDIYDYEESWFDHSQIYINSKFCEPALWFDNFFANDRLFEEGVAGTYIRWRNAFTYDEEEGFGFKTKLKASVELPRTKQRLRVTFEGDESEDLRDILPVNEEGTRNSLGLQLDLLKSSRSKFNVDVSLSPKIRFRYRYTYPLQDNLILRFTQELQRKEQVNSARTEFNIEHVFNRNLLFRATSQGKLSDEFDGIDWSQALVLYQRVDKKTSLSLQME